MAKKSATLRRCKNNHRYYKSSACPTCPICEAERQPKEGFLALLAAPARRALENEGIAQLKDLTRYSESELLRLHGFGKSSLPKLRSALSAAGWSLKK